MIKSHFEHVLELQNLCVSMKMNGCFRGNFSMALLCAIDKVFNIICFISNLRIQILAIFKC